MCGIAGIAGENSQSALLDMLNSTKHRGPDDYGIYNSEKFTIGMNRLSVIDLSSAGHQPMISNDGRYVIVYNGEMYNYLEERTLLINEGIIFNSDSDTEVVLQLFIKYGENCLERIRGMFAFVILDNCKLELFGARDRLGIKPLLYFYNQDKFIFCSEMKGMLSSSLINKRLDLESVSQYLVQGYVTSPNTIIENVKSLMPGCFFTYKASELVISKYWDFDETSRPLISYDEACIEVRSLVTNSVNEEMVSDVPIGVFLSGGLDSNVIVAALCASGHKNVETFSINFESGNFESDETLDSQKSANHFKTKHHIYTVSGQDICNEFDDFINSLDQPSIDGINTYFVSKFSKNHVTVALSGLGGDELFFGYGTQRYIYHNFGINYRIVKYLFPLYRFFVKWIPIALGNKLDFIFSKLNFSEYYSFISRINTPASIKKLLKVKYRTTRPINDYLPRRFDNFNLNAPISLIKRIIAADSKIFMSSRLLRDGDSTSMFHSLEVRYPLIDHRLVEFVCRLPDVFIYNAESDERKDKHNYLLTFEKNQVKKLLYDSFKDLLPVDFELRGKKGFVFPVQNWMEDALNQRLEDLLHDDSFIFNLKFINKQKNLNMWPLLILREWCIMNNIKV